MQSRDLSVKKEEGKQHMTIVPIWYNKKIQNWERNNLSEFKNQKTIYLNSVDVENRLLLHLNCFNWNESNGLCKTKSLTKIPSCILAARWVNLLLTDFKNDMYMKLHNFWHNNAVDEKWRTFFLRTAIRCNSWYFVTF